MSIRNSLRLLLALIILFPLFTHLDALPIVQWDEARYANNAFEMYNSHNWLILTYDGSPDMWYTKPPMMIWLQVLFMKIVGINELAIRLPAALAAAGTCLLIFSFFAKRYKAPLLGVISVLILITIKGYVTGHGTRTGDLDSLLTFFTTGYVLSYFVYLEGGNKKDLYLTYVLLLFAIMTKSIEAVLFLPSLLIYTIYKKKLITVLRSRHTYVGLAGVVFFVAGYYLLRDHYNPGYINAVWENEIVGRYNTVIESHEGDMWYYVDGMMNNDFKDWYMLVIPGIFLGISSKTKWIKDFTVYATLLILLYLIVISGGQTKLYWYNIPMYPLLSILVGIFLYSIYKVLIDTENWKEYFSYNPMSYVLLFLILIIPYSEITARSLLKGGGERNMARFLKDVLHHDRNIDGYAILNGTRDENLNFYYKVLKHYKRPIDIIDTNEITPYGKIIAFQPYSKQYIETHYKIRSALTDGSVAMYQLNGLKPKIIDSTSLSMAHQ